MPHSEENSTQQIICGTGKNRARLRWLHWSMPKTRQVNTPCTSSSLTCMDSSSLGFGSGLASVREANVFSRANCSALSHRECTHGGRRASAGVAKRLTPGPDYVCATLQVGSAHSRYCLLQRRRRKKAPGKLTTSFDTVLYHPQCEAQ